MRKLTGDGGRKGTMTDTKTESPTDVRVEPLVRALRDLLKNPMPHDLIAIRRDVATEYGGDEEAAKQAMGEWCSQEYMEHKVEAHRKARHNAAEVLREYGPNDQAQRPGTRDAGPT